MRRRSHKTWVKRQEGTGRESRAMEERLAPAGRRTHDRAMTPMQTSSAAVKRAARYGIATTVQTCTRLLTTSVPRVRRCVMRVGAKGTQGKRDA